MRALLAITLGLNVVLAVALFRTGTGRDSGAGPAGQSAMEDAANGATAFTHRRVVTVRDDSPWAALAAGDFSHAVERLREAGCPEETVRDILIAAVSRRYYSQSIEREEQRQRNFKWWRGIQDSDAEYNPSENIEARAQRDLELGKLLGPGWRDAMAKLTGLPSGSGYWSFMSKEARSQMEALNAKYSRLEQEVRARARASFLLEEEEAQLKALKEQKRAELAQVLTPKELEELELRQSPAANWVRQKLPEPASEEEYRIMVRAAQAANKDVMTENGLLNGESPQDAQKRREAEQQTFQAQLKEALGEARYADLFPNAPPGKRPEPTFEESAERARQQLVKQAQQEGVSAEAANQAHARLVAFIKEWEKKTGDINKLPPEKQQELSETMKTEGEKIFIETMGEKGRKVFQRMNGP